MPDWTISLFEHEFISYAEIGLSLHDGQPRARARSEQVLEELERLNKATGQEIFRLERKGLRARSLVGVVRAGEITFQIFPKIDVPEKGSAREPQSGSSAASNLLAMLSYAYDLNLYEQDSASLETQEGDWLELLIRLFSSGLHRQILSGLSHSYVTREETLPMLRGRWDVQRQIIRHGPARHRFDVIYDELTADIPLNQVFRFVVEQLLPLSRERNNQLLLGELRDWFSPITRLAEVTPELLGEVHFNRLNERFLPLFNLACLFLSGSSIQLTAGRLPVLSFVFDMNALFERFAAAFLERHKREILPANWQDVRIAPQSEGARLFLARCNGRNLVQLRPDLLFIRPGQSEPLLIADTKYKTPNPAEHKQGIDPADIYQMVAYSVRFKCPRVLLLYPQTGKSGAVRKQMEVSSAGLSLTIATLNLQTPLHRPEPLITELRSIIAFALE